MYSLAVAILAMFIAGGSAFAQTGRGQMGNGNAGTGNHMGGGAGYGMTGSGAMGKGQMGNGNTGAGSHMGGGTVEEPRSQKGQLRGSYPRAPHQRGQNPRRR
jgi:hypothetical protein